MPAGPRPIRGSEAGGQRGSNCRASGQGNPLPVPDQLSVLPALAARLAQRTLRSHGDTGRPWASVAVVLAPEPDSILLIQRADRDSDVWSGHLAFPGGRRGPNDPDLLTTARRETLEEVGFDLGGAQLIGQLDDLATRGPVLPPLVVRPFVFTAPAAGSLTPNREVAAAWWVPLETFSRSGVFGRPSTDGMEPWYGRRVITFRWECCGG